MADIDVVRKGGIPAWVWLLLAVVVVIGLFALMNRNNTADDRTASPQSYAAPLLDAPQHVAAA